MTKVTLYGLDKEVEYDENDTFPVTLDNGDTYDECAWTEEPRHLIAYDPAINDWVQLM